MATRLHSALLAGAVATSVIATAEVAQSATPDFNGGSSILSSITDLSIPGYGIFDVNFRTPNFNGAYGGNNPFFLGNEAGADAAVDAINSVLDITSVNGLEFGEGLNNNGNTNQGFGATQRNAYLVPYLLQNGDSEVLNKLGSYDGDDWVRSNFAAVAVTESGSQTAPTTSYAIFTQTQAVPTPALLPGLIGFGMSVVRKRKKQQDNLLSAA